MALLAEAFALGGVQHGALPRLASKPGQAAHELPERGSPTTLAAVATAVAAGVVAKRRSAKTRAAVAMRGEEESAPLREKMEKVQAGDRFVGWVKHPVLTTRQKFDLVVEVGPGDDKGAWKITDPNKRLQAGKSYEGPCKVIAEEGDSIIFRDEDTVLNGTLNGAGPGTISGRAMQGGLKWGGFFEVAREAD
ncbi:hypothetical protein AK812_SmicGene19502 [Symbiodinium microadriaticum]|uniref:Uncharacterized protein n=1 Tax=Symbiodinium microadriaticum TaxID=2951 RepID=A0A1Q9DSE5_SYMMI|nr:hypothetical protein AK812_SmicGene19502 [Symbiodinium microadriaticum]